MEDRDFSYYPVTPQQPRKKPMQVFCFGLSRTATISLYIALTKLGYTPYHGIEATLDHKNDSLKHWHEAIDAKFYGKGKKYAGKDFEKMLWRYDAVVELPSYFFVDELLEAYPDAKVVLNTRDPDKWATSIENTFGKVLKWKRWAVLEYLDGQYVAHYIPILQHCYRTWATPSPPSSTKSTSPSPSATDLHATLRTSFAAHNAHVTAAVPASNLLVWEVKDGWGPLCAFLGKPVPKKKRKKEEPNGHAMPNGSTLPNGGPKEEEVEEEEEEEEEFPRINEGSFIVDVHAFMFWKRLVEVAWLGVRAKWEVPVGVLLAAGWYYFGVKR